MYHDKKLFSSSPLPAHENFSQSELEYLRNEPDKKTAFFDIWTRKEAFIKARGMGMHFPLKSFSIDIRLNGSCEKVLIPNLPDESGLWKTSTLKAYNNYKAALAIKSDNFYILYFQL